MARKPKMEVIIRGNAGSNATPAGDLGRVENGLGDAIGYNQFSAIQGFGTQYGGAAISQAEPIFKNLRWYMVSNYRQMLSQAYVEIGLVQTICIVPVDDALRGGCKFKSRQLDEKQLEELQASMDRDGIRVNGQAAVWNRLFGGGGVLILTDQDPMTPLDIEAIGPDERLEFRAVEMWELFYAYEGLEGTNLYGDDSEEFEFYNYYGEQVHRSRVLRLDGIEAPSFIRPRLQGWGVSVVEILVRSINQYLKATDLGYEVLDEFKLDIYKIKDLTNTLFSPVGKQQVAERIRMANWQKNYQNAVVLDKEDDYDHKQLSFAGLAEAMEGIRMQVASDMRMPMLKLFGTPSQGLGASDEDSLEVYNSMVESQVRAKIKYNLLKTAEIKCQKMFGLVPDDLSIEFAPLRVMSSEQEETVKTQKYTRLMQAKQAGEITTQEFRDACNKGNLFDVKLDTSEDALSEIELQKSDLAQEQDEQDVESGDNDMPASRIVNSAFDSPLNDSSRVSNAKVRISSYTRSERLVRTVTNSKDYDKASYDADGGDSWIDPRRLPVLSRDEAIDKGLWEMSRERSRAIYGEVKDAFVLWFYKKSGGRLSPSADI